MTTTGATGSFHQTELRKMEIPKTEQFIYLDQLTAKRVGEKLEQKYPGWLWAVHVMDGVVSIKSLRVSGLYGYVLHEDQIDNDGRAVVHAGGEILERFGQKRGPFDYTTWMNTPMDVRGTLDGDKS